MPREKFTAKEILLAVVAICPALGAVVADDFPSVCLMLAISLIATVYLCYIHHAAPWKRVLAAILASAVLIFLGWRHFILHGHPDAARKLEAPAAVAKKQDIKPPTIHDLFMNDFSLLSYNGILEAALDAQHGDGRISGIEYKVWDDFSANSKFISVYVPKTQYLFDVLVALADSCQEKTKTRSRNVTLPSAAYVGKGAALSVINNSLHIEVKFKNPGDTSWVNDSELKFSGRIYLYFEDDLSPFQLGALDEWFRSKSLFPQLRGNDYATAKWLQEQANNSKIK